MDCKTTARTKSAALSVTHHLSRCRTASCLFVITLQAVAGAGETTRRSPGVMTDSLTAVLQCAHLQCPWGTPPHARDRITFYTPPTRLPFHRGHVEDTMQILVMQSPSQATHSLSMISSGRFGVYNQSQFWFSVEVLARAIIFNLESAGPFISWNGSTQSFQDTKLPS